MALDESPTRCVDGAWVVYTRSNDWAPVVRSIHAEELLAYRAAAQLLDERGKVHFVPWNATFDPDAAAEPERHFDPVDAVLRPRTQDSHEGR